MTKAGARNILRRRLNERTADGWNDTELDELINEAVKQVQKSVLKVDAYAFLEIAITPTEVGTAGEFYCVPPTMWYEFEVGYKATAAQTNYTRLTRGNYHAMREVATSATPQYARHGQYFAIWPNPTAAVIDGLRVQYMPTLTVGDAEAAVLPVHPALHMAVPVWATMMAIGETMEDNSVLARELSGYIGDIPEWYHRGGDPIQLRLAANTTRY